MRDLGRNQKSSGETVGDSRDSKQFLLELGESEKCVRTV